MIRRISFRPSQKNTLRGFADLELTRVGLVLHDCTWHPHPNGREWISFPARRHEDPSDDTLWQSNVEFVAGANQAREQFQHQALDAAHPAIKGESAACLNITREERRSAHANE